MTPLDELSRVMSEIAHRRWDNASARDRADVGELLRVARMKRTTAAQRRAIAQKAAKASARVRSARARARRAEGR